MQAAAPHFPVNSRVKCGKRRNICIDQYDNLARVVTEMSQQGTLRSDRQSETAIYSFSLAELAAQNCATLMEPLGTDRPDELWNGYSMSERHRNKPQNGHE